MLNTERKEATTIKKKHSISQVSPRTYLSCTCKCYRPRHPRFRLHRHLRVTGEFPTMEKPSVGSSCSAREDRANMMQIKKYHITTAPEVQKQICSSILYIDNAGDEVILMHITTCGCAGYTFAPSFLLRRRGKSMVVTHQLKQELRPPFHFLIYRLDKW